MSESTFNYFNYFTEIEEHFQRARGTSLFLLSPLDWALIETWKNSGVPLEAVVRGIDAAFEKWRAKRSRAQMVNSLAFCAQAILLETQRMADAGTARPETGTAASEPFAAGEVQRYIAGNAAAVRNAAGGDFTGIAEALEALAEGIGPGGPDLEKLEQRLTALEEKMVAIARARQGDKDALRAREELEAQLRPYRGKMTAPQIAMLEKQFLERNVLEALALPRLSLFYLR